MMMMMISLSLPPSLSHSLSLSLSLSLLLEEQPPPPRASLMRSARGAKRKWRQNLRLVKLSAPSLPPPLLGLSALIPPRAIPGPPRAARPNIVHAGVEGGGYGQVRLRLSVTPADVPSYLSVIRTSSFRHPCLLLAPALTQWWKRARRSPVLRIHTPMSPLTSFAMMWACSCILSALSRCPSDSNASPR